MAQNVIRIVLIAFVILFIVSILLFHLVAYEYGKTLDQNLLDGGVDRFDNSKDHCDLEPPFQCKEILRDKSKVQLTIEPSIDGIIFSTTQCVAGEPTYTQNGYATTITIPCESAQERELRATVTITAGSEKTTGIVYFTANSFLFSS